MEFFSEMNLYLPAGNQHKSSHKRNPAAAGGGAGGGRDNSTQQTSPHYCSTIQQQNIKEQTIESTVQSSMARHQLTYFWKPLIISLLTTPRTRPFSVVVTPTTTAPPRPERMFWNVCDRCQGQARIRKATTKKKRRAVGDRERRVRYEPCSECNRTGIVRSKTPPTTNNNVDLHVAIVGGGLSGLALATALSHRGISHTVFERDAHFEQRSQGYGLTMQQASKVLADFGIQELLEGVTSTKHVVHEANGTVVGTWGMRHWQSQQGKTEEEGKAGPGKKKSNKKRQNIHIARQALRHELLKSATALGNDSIRWNHRFLSYSTTETNKLKLLFETEIEGKTETVSHFADMVVACDGIRSCVRQQVVGEDETPLRYLDIFVMLGICPLHQDNIPATNPLLDGQTVFQTADGTTRMYMMPYSKSAYMWQLSFPMPNQQEAIELYQNGSASQLQEALRRCDTWHEPIPQILRATPTDLVSGYPVYDREILTRENLRGCNETPRQVTLMGDAAHPMSPFKGQGANQALLDALSLARALYRACRQHRTDDDKLAIIKTALEEYEPEMLTRSSVKVQGSAEAAHFLHSKVAIQKGNVTRGAASRLNNDHSLDSEHQD